MKIESAAVTNVGRVRGNNEDNFYLCGQYKKNTETDNCRFTDEGKRAEYVFSVCDGMGGIQFGELASLIAVETVAKYAESFDANCEKCIEEANGLICEEIEKHGGRRIGTTFAALCIRDGAARGYNIGDSRIYFLRDGRLSQLSVDHTQAQMLVNHGIITAEAAKTHRDRNVLTQHLGIFPEEMLLEAHVTEAITVAPGDSFLLCSDGLTDMVEDEAICAILSSDGAAGDKADCLVEAALANGGRDNVTVVLVCVSEEAKLRVDLELAERKLRESMMAKGGAVNEELLAEIMDNMRKRLE